uniref:Uncharacterized protein n=1 Tax=Sciurus vulgaris TaxID=55149 RepID=A0A8D2CPJ6_SCIVU
MSSQSPCTLLELAGRSLLMDRQRATLALQDLPIELFPPLFMEAFSGGCSEVLKEMVQAWPFTCLPLGALMKKPDLEMLQVTLQGLNMLLAQRDRPRHLKNPLETLSITNCQPSDLDWNHLSGSPNLTQLLHLNLCGIKQTNLSPEPLRILLENAAATLRTLNLQDCEITDSQLHALLPALSGCSQLRTFSFHGNDISLPVMRDLLRHTARLRQLSLEMYPAPLESYDAQGAIHRERFFQHCAELTDILRAVREPRGVLFHTKPCHICGHRFVYNLPSSLCRCLMPA